MQRVLIATDFSRSARAASTRSALLPLSPRPDVDLVHVLPKSVPAGTGVEARARRDLAEEGRRLEGLFRKSGLHGKVRLDMLYGAAFLTIIQRARGMDAELLVVGRRGRGRARLFVGSTAERLVSRAGRPVLVVGPWPRGPYKRVLFALEAAPESRRVAETARRILPDAVQASVLYAVEVPFEGYALVGRASDEVIRRQREDSGKSSLKVLDPLARALTASGVASRVLLRHGDARVAILQAIRRSRCDLVVVGSHGQGVVSGVLIGSVAQEIVRSASSDVLVVPTRDVALSP